jgi:hypothetical protein
MANTLLTISMITREALRVLENNLTFTKQVNRQYDSRFGVEGAQIGTVLNVRKPPRYVGRTGTAISIEDATETQVAVTLDTQFGVDITFTSEDLALKISDFSKRFITPAVATIANKIDASGLALYTSVYNSVGVPGTPGPTTLLDYLNAGVALDNDACPMDGQRSVCITPSQQAQIVNALKGLFQQSSAIASQYRRGQMGEAVGFQWYMDQNCNTHTTGTFTTGSTPLVKGASQTGASLITDGWANSTAVIKKGDVFTIADVNHVNPQSLTSVATAQQFVATADGTSDGSGNLTISISPSITTGTGFQTVDASPGDNAAITMVGAEAKQSPQGLAFHKDAFTLAMADLPLPQGTDMAARVSDDQLGMSIRLIRDYDITTDKFPCRLDVLFGWAALRPELACRLQG